MTTNKQPYHDLLYAYDNGNYRVGIFDDGTKVRSCEFHDTDMTPVFPESIDLKITDYCDGACEWCHEKSTKQGRHADLQPMISLLRGLPAGVEVAIGGGDPLSHPSFVEFVTQLTEHGIICNVTINEKHFDKYKNKLEYLTGLNLIKGVGYSYKTKPCTWKYQNLVTHVIVGVTDPEELNDIVSVNKKVLLLGYKTFGRGEKFFEKNREKVNLNILKWYRNLFSVAFRCHLSFDNLAIKQLNPSRLLSDKEFESFYMGDDGTFTMYMDAVKQVYGVSSTSSQRKPISGSIQEMFKDVRASSCLQSSSTLLTGE